ncbi:MAG: hypothetical protein ACI4CC_08645 [Lachnospiraceae bacterium]
MQETQMKQIKELSDRLFDLRDIQDYLKSCERLDGKSVSCTIDCKNKKADLNVPIPYLMELANNELKETRDALNVILEESKESEENAND